MQALGRRYVRFVNDRYRCTGTLWEGRYKSCLVDSETYLLRCYRYIELNPVRAGMVALPLDYRWSSHAANAAGHHDPLVSEHSVYQALGATRANANSRTVASSIRPLLQTRSTPSDSTCSASMRWGQVGSKTRSNVNSLAVSDLQRWAVPASSFKARKLHSDPCF